ncbi:MAG: hypothetical protein QME93_04470 [Bacillota bacterium]|nr:hypothetical protein [Bacillota bacterium]
MGDNSPKEFDWSTVQSEEVLEESRAYRFQPEWRPLLLQFLGLAPGMHALEVGCGPGTLALGEMIRVCRPGGTVSVAEGVAGPQGICFEGVDYLGHPCYGQERRYWELSQKVRRLLLEHLLPRQGLGSSHWPARSFFALLSRAGLEGVRVHAWGCCRAPDDARMSPQERVRLREQQYRVARQQLESLWRSGEAEVLFQHGLTPGELEELIQLCEARFRWSLEHPLYDWEASLSVVVAGQKPRRR